MNILNSNFLVFLVNGDNCHDLDPFLTSPYLNFAFLILQIDNVIQFSLMSLLFYTDFFIVRLLDFN